MSPYCEIEFSFMPCGLWTAKNECKFWFVETYSLGWASFFMNSNNDTCLVVQGKVNSFGLLRLLRPEDPKRKKNCQLIQNGEKCKKFKKNSGLFWPLQPFSSLNSKPNGLIFNAFLYVRNIVLIFIHNKMSNINRDFRKILTHSTLGMPKLQRKLVMGICNDKKVAW